MPGTEGIRHGRTGKVVIASTCVGALALLVVLSMAHVIAFKPSNISDAAWSAGKQAYAIAQDYDAGRITTAEAKARLAAVDTSYGKAGTGDDRTNAGDAHVAYCVQALASHVSMQGTHEGPGGSGINDMHGTIRDDMAELAKAIGY